MRNKSSLNCLVSILAPGVPLLAAASVAVGAEVNTFRTNYTERWITNVVEVRIPTNIFVNEFRTNWLSHTLTNVVDVYATNWRTATLTNVVSVPGTRTVQVTQYQTNWSTLTQTNRVAVDQVHTNFVTRWQTNSRSLTLTNWETVLVMKTNWVLRPVTNVVQIDLITNPPPGTTFAETIKAADAPPAIEQPKEAGVESVPAPAVASLTDALKFDIWSGGRQQPRNVVQVRLNVHWKADPTASVDVQQWHVESENGAILCTSQEREFRRELPLGRYKVEVRTQKSAGGRPLVARTILSLTGTEAVVLPLASARR